MTVTFKLLLDYSFTSLLLNPFLIMFSFFFFFHDIISITSERQETKNPGSLIDTRSFFRYLFWSYLKRLDFTLQSTPLNATRDE